ncbi:MAG TPA: oligopeptide:H+ symporter [Pseudomonadota bacterium]|nr:MFS transporter [Xanthomonadales bacterium]HQW81450.1 oligopeptide:H+ symporter [Pseudomonadota bacterium]
MSGASLPNQSAPPEFGQLMGHPRPLWMLFMAEFWERFAFYGIRWALVLYIVAQFHGGDPSGQQSAGLIYGSYLALVYAGAIFGGLVADKFLGYQRSILVGAVIMAAGLFMISVPSEAVFKLGLATIVVGNGLFKPIISTLVGKIYSAGDERRDSGFTIFYMGINLGAMISPLLTQILAQKIFGDDSMPAYKMVFIAAGIGMLISLVWFWFGRGQLKGVGEAPEGASGLGRVVAVFLGAAAAVPVVYYLLAIGAEKLQVVLTVMFVLLAVMLVVEGIKNGAVARDKVIAMLIIFAFNILFWMFFEQAGSSFTFLADQIVNRDLGFMTFPTAWFQSVNSVAIIVLAPIIAWAWIKMGSWNPSIPRKFGLGILFNGLAFLLLMFALSSLVDPATLKIPFWTLIAVYWIQSIGELCLSPIGLSMVTKLAPLRLVGFGMGGWFLSTGIGNNLSGLFASHASGEGGMTVASAQAAYEQGFWILLIGGVLLFLLAPLIQKLMHGVK